MICPECFKGMQERGPDDYICLGCGFEAEQMNIWEWVGLREFNKAMPNYTEVVTYSMSEGERAALEARERSKKKRETGEYYITAPQRGYGNKYLKKGGERK